MKILWLFFFVQAVFESFPVSSSGHIQIIKFFFTLTFLDKAYKVLDRLAHGPTILILVIYFYKEWSSILFRVLRFERHRASYHRLLQVFLRIVGYVFIVDIMSIAAYLLFSKGLKSISWLQSDWATVVGFVITMAALLSLKKLERRGHNGLECRGQACRKKKEKKEDKEDREDKEKKESCDVLNIQKVILIGLAQGIAFFPGISRLGATYVAGRWLNLSARRSFQFSFLFQFPLMVAAFIFEGLYLLPKASFANGYRLIFLFYSPQTWLVVIIATVLGYAGLHLVYRSGIEKKMWRFGIYMIIPALILFWLTISY